MIDIKNEITRDFINKKVAELTNNDALSNINTIDSFIDTEIDVISRALKDRLISERKQIIENLKTDIMNKNNQISKLNNQINDYEQDLQAIEQFKGFKRKSKFFN